MKPDEKTLSLAHLTRTERGQQGGNTQFVLPADWRLMACDQSAGKDFLQDWGPEAHMMAEVHREAVKGRDVWLISPEGHKWLPKWFDGPEYRLVPADQEPPARIDQLISLWSARPQPRTPRGDIWEDGARQGYKWGIEDVKKVKEEHSRFLMTLLDVATGQSNLTPQLFNIEELLRGKLFPSK